MGTHESFCIIKADIKVRCRADAAGPAHDLEDGSESELEPESESESESETSSVIEEDRGCVCRITETEKRFYERRGRFFKSVHFHRGMFFDCWGSVLHRSLLHIRIDITTIRAGVASGVSLITPERPTPDERNLHNKLLPHSLSGGTFNVRRMQGHWDQAVADNVAKPPGDCLNLGAATPLSLEKLRENIVHKDAVQQGREDIQTVGSSTGECG